MSDDMTCRSQRRRRKRRGERDGGFIQHREMGKRNSKRQTRKRDTRIIDYQSKTMLYRTTEDMYNST
jgi:hypothetical protein